MCWQSNEVANSSLRNLTVVRGVEWPQKVMDYLLRMSEASGVPLYFDRAL